MTFAVGIKGIFGHLLFSFFFHIHWTTLQRSSPLKKAFEEANIFLNFINLALDIESKQDKKLG